MSCRLTITIVGCSLLLSIFRFDQDHLYFKTGYLKRTRQIEIPHRAFTSIGDRLHHWLSLIDDVHLSTARHFRDELRLPIGGKFLAAIWSAGGMPRIPKQAKYWWWKSKNFHGYNEHFNINKWIGQKVYLT